MTEHIEARSLAELNFLAAHPPQYPTNPTEKRQDPVILYISRVPGTRDIILSPFKPQVKNVTADDVASSLYYVHLDGPEDELLVPLEQARASSSPRSSSESRRNQIQRKPLPATAYLRDVKDPLVDPATYTIHPALRPEKLIRDDHVQQNARFDPAFLPPQKPAGPAAGPVQRKPLGSRAMATGNNGDHPLPPIPVNGNEPPLPPRPNQQENIPPSTDTHAALSPSPMRTRPIRSPSPSKRPFRPFSLTLIRRDRISDQQWNVGKISSVQLDHTEQFSDDKYSQAAPSILIHLETSGYAKFRGMPTRPSIASAGDIRRSFDMMRPHSSGTNSVSPFGSDDLLNRQPPPPPPPPPQQQQHPVQGGFDREVKMAYSPSLMANIQHAFNKTRHRRRSSESPTSPSKSPGRHNRHDSATSIRSFGGDFDFGGGNSGSAESPIITHPGPGLKPRGYVFDSPWGGRCEFVTGNAGRTLKCRHVLPNFTGHVFNPLVAESGGGGGGGGGADGEHRRGRGNSFGGAGGGSSGSSSHKKALAVSELRFNLPSSEVLFSKDTSGSPRARDQIQGQFQRLRDNAANTQNSKKGGGSGGGSGGGGGGGYSDDDGGDFRLDMSLGREKAGGGNRGSRAKMGKLIIAPDGLKMLDLVVAANVGVWWTSWERTFGDETW